MNVVRRLAVAAALAAGVLIGTGAAAQASAPPPREAAPLGDPALEARVHKLSAELRCLVCQNQSLADSNAELALDLKNEVREQLRSGRSEKQVVEYLTQRYGDFVLYRPPLKPTTLLLWTGPALLLLLGGVLLWRALRRAAATAAADDFSAADQARAQALLSGDEPRR